MEDTESTERKNCAPKGRAKLSFSVSSVVESFLGPGAGDQQTLRCLPLARRSRSTMRCLALPCVTSQRTCAVESMNS